tara:strand:+ start:825 stop:1205 length:381 start_codon:yes stop_codon:yes gene_type:complete
MKYLSRLLLAFVLLQAFSALAAGKAFTQSDFDVLESTGKPIVIHVHADWCSTCKSQDAILNPIIKSSEFNGVTFFQVNFDDQKEVLKKFNVANQSTIIVIKNGKEVGRLIGDTKQSSINALVKKSL